jgi:hypothetical protein
MERAETSSQDAGADPRDTIRTTELGGVYRSDQERRAADRIAEQTPVTRRDIASVDRDGDRLQPRLTDAAREERAREQFREQRVGTPAELAVAGNDPPQAGLSPGQDLRFEATDDGVATEVTDQGARKLIARQNDGIDVQDIESVERTEDGQLRPRLTDAAREERAREVIAEENPEIEAGNIAEIEQTEDGQLQPVFTDDFRRERARETAAEDDPLRESEDFVATVEDGEAEVRQRQAPLFEDAREELGLNPPEESGVFRALQRGSKEYQNRVETLVDIGEAQDPTPGQTVKIGDRTTNLDAADRGGTLGAAAVLNIPGAILDARTVASQGVDLSRAVVEDKLSESEEATPIKDEGSGLEEAGPINIKEGEKSPGVGEKTQDELIENADAVASQYETLEEAYEQNPSQTTGAVAGALGVGAVASAGGGIAVGRASRRATDAVATVGRRKTFDADDLTVDETARYYDPEAAGRPTEGRFPGADAPELYERSPDVAVRTQATRDRPEAIKERFEEAGIKETQETADLYKAIETEPEGPGQGAGGFGAPPREGRISYEAEGAFFSPDLSPAFFRTGFGSADFSPRPGLPSLGDRPTGLVARGRVTEPEADDLRGFNEELAATDDPSFRTKPESEVNSGEIEAVLPEGTELVDVGNRGLIQSAARRVGIGSDFAVEIGNRRIPLRPVTDPELRESGGGLLSRLLDDDRGSVGARAPDDAGELIGPRRYRAEVSRRQPSGGVDRPIPLAPNAADSSSTTAAGQTPGGSSPADPESPLSNLGGGSSPGSSGSGGGGSSGFLFGGGDSSFGGSGSSGGGGGSSVPPSTPPSTPTPPPPPTTPPSTPPGDPQLPRRGPRIDPSEDEDEEERPPELFEGVREVEARLAQSELDVGTPNPDDIVGGDPLEDQQ